MRCFSLVGLEARVRRLEHELLVLKIKRGLEEIQRDIEDIRWRVFEHEREVEVKRQDDWVYPYYGGYPFHYLGNRSASLPTGRSGFIDPMKG